MNVLITGGAGFIGSNLIHLLRRERPGWRIVNLDLLTYAANLENLRGLSEGPYYRFVRGDVANRELVAELFQEERFRHVIHCAAESHVDRSIHDGGIFLRTNVEGTLVLLEAELALGGVRHLQMSTDEVYGTLAPEDPPFHEGTPLSPRSPYSASKAAADLMVEAFHHTHGADTIITRCSNNYGPYQHPEKLVPLMITSAIEGRELPVYGDGRQRRDWIYVEDHCRGVLAALEQGQSGEVYNFGGAAEKENIEVVREILRLTGGREEQIRYVADRPGHDRRYSVQFTRAERELGWHPQVAFPEGMERTVRWYQEHRSYWEQLARDSYTASQERLRSWEGKR